MELSHPWETASLSDTQEFPPPPKMKNPKVRYHAQKSPQLVPLVSQINPVYTSPSYLSKDHFYYTLTYV
jgi:hypothetical protein